jgi:hypothetical protein
VEQLLLVVLLMVIVAKQLFMEWLLLVVVLVAEQLQLNHPQELLVAVAQAVVLILQPTEQDPLAV